jgi:hypothetical protein
LSKDKKTKTIPSPTLENIKKDIERVAELLGTEPTALTKTKYFSFPTSYYREWTFRKHGGYAAVLRECFGMATAQHGDDPRDIASIQGTRDRNNFVSALRKELGTHVQQVERFRAAMLDALKTHPIMRAKNTKCLVPTKNSNHERAVSVLISDDHFGNNVDPREVEENQYNWTIAARRFARVIHDVAHFKLDHRKECERLILNLGGDLCQGIIHPDDSSTELMTHQMVGTARMIIEALDYLLQFYPIIDVPVTPDNHMRLFTHTKGKGKAVTQKFDSFNTMMIESVQQAFRNEPRVRFNIPMTPYTTYKVFDRTHFLTHGDTVLKLGYPGSSVATSAISAQIDRMNAGRSEADRIQLVLAGHVHTGTYIALQNDVDCFINPPLSSVDPFTQSIGYLKNRVGQWMIEHTRDMRCGDQRIIWVHKADDDASMEQIITPFDYSLALRKVGG